jgi:hypothetical protein
MRSIRTAALVFGFPIGVLLGVSLLVLVFRYIYVEMRGPVVDEVHLAANVKRQSSWPVVLPHLIIRLSQKALPHLKDTNYNTLVSCGRITVLNLAS